MLCHSDMHQNWLLSTGFVCLQAFTLRDAGAVMHSHSVNAVLATLLDGGSEFRVTNLEMIKVTQSSVQGRCFRFAPAVCA